MLRVPCITLREETEWIETVQSGWNQLVGANTQLISDTLDKLEAPAQYAQIYGDGNTTKTIIEILKTAWIEIIRIFIMKLAGTRKSHSRGLLRHFLMMIIPREARGD